MKTISELNKTMWYRTLKVLYIFFVILCLVLTIQSSIAIYNLIKTNRDTFMAESKIRFERMAFIEVMKNKGSSTKQITDAFREKYDKDDGLLTLHRDEFKSIYGLEEYNKFENNTEKQEEFKSEFPSTMNWLFLFIPVLIIMSWLTIQLPKWIFYYIVLGSVKSNINCHEK